MSVSVCLLTISKTMKLRYNLILMNILNERLNNRSILLPILMNILNERLNNRSMNLQLRPSPTI